MVAIPETRYATDGGLHVAYQLVGDGPVDIVRFIQNYFQPRSTTRVSAGQAAEQDHVKGGFE
jgi:hypothetical protein